MPTQILFIRHGETDWNRIKRIQGHIDIPLATSGVEQAQRLGERFAHEAEQGERVDAIYSSDLQRAQQTAQPIADALHLPLQLDGGLRERDYGAFQGYDTDQIAQRFPKEYAAWQTRDADFAPPEGESQRGFYERVLGAVQRIAAAHPDGRIVVVAHGGVLDCVHRFARGLSLDVQRDYALLNTSVNIVDFNDGKAAIVSWADVAHLGDAASSDDGLQRRATEPGR